MNKNTIRLHDSGSLPLERHRLQTEAVLRSLEHMHVELASLLDDLVQAAKGPSSGATDLDDILGDAAHSVRKAADEVTLARRNLRR